MKIMTAKDGIIVSKELTKTWGQDWNTSEIGILEEYYTRTLLSTS
jgi:hypothetical protein